MSHFPSSSKIQQQERTAKCVVHYYEQKVGCGISGKKVDPLGPPEKEPGSVISPGQMAPLRRQRSHTQRSLRSTFPTTPDEFFFFGGGGSEVVGKDSLNMMADCLKFLKRHSHTASETGSNSETRCHSCGTRLTRCSVLSSLGRLEAGVGPRAADLTVVDVARLEPERRARARCSHGKKHV